MDTKDTTPIDDVAEFPVWVTAKTKENYPDPVMSALHALPPERYNQMKRKFETMMIKEALSMPLEERSTWLKRARKDYSVKITLITQNSSDKVFDFPSETTAASALFTWLAKHPQWKSNNIPTFDLKTCQHLVASEETILFWKDEPYKKGEWTRKQTIFLKIGIEHIQPYASKINIRRCECTKNVPAPCYENEDEEDEYKDDENSEDDEDEDKK